MLRLKKKEKTPFDRLFVASQSSDDIYNLIDPYSEGGFGTTDDGDFFIEFELRDAIIINGIQIFSSYSCFPKSFNIEIDGKCIQRITEAKDLNGKNKQMTVLFGPVKCLKLRIIQTGPNWDEGDTFLYFKRFEFLSPEEKYSNGVFASFIKNIANNDPHLCPVILSAKNFDFNTFHSLDSDGNICTSGKQNSWFQVEFTKGLAVISGFRLKRCELGKLKSFKIICTNNVNDPNTEWYKLIEINEVDKEEHKQLDIYEFPHPSPPIKFIRLVQTDKNWSGGFFLKIIHLDFFGIYF